MKQKLTPIEREKLQKQHRKERDKRTCDRIKAVLAYDDGYSYSEIARILLLDDETIRRHIEDYFKRKKLSPEQGGSEGYLSQSETLLLIAHLKDRTYLYVKEICAYVENFFKKTYIPITLQNAKLSHNPVIASEAKQSSFCGNQQLREELDCHSHCATSQ
jgi:transposase